VPATPPRPRPRLSSVGRGRRLHARQPDAPARATSRHQGAAALQGPAACLQRSTIEATATTVERATGRLRHHLTREGSNRTSSARVTPRDRPLRSCCRPARSKKKAPSRRSRLGVTWGRWRPSRGPRAGVALNAPGLAKGCGSPSETCRCGSGRPALLALDERCGRPGSPGNRGRKPSPAVRAVPGGRIAGAERRRSGLCGRLRPRWGGLRRRFGGEIVATAPSRG
jgi:hypothetical protein